MKKLSIVLGVITILLVGGTAPVLGTLQVPPLVQPQLQPLLEYLLRPDLEVEEIWCTTPGGTLAFSVINSGFSPLPDGWESYTHLTARVFHISGGIEVPLGEFNLCLPSSTENGGIGIPDGISNYVTSIILEGEAIVKVEVDYHDRIQELNEVNNFELTIYTPCGRGTMPDLEASFVALPVDTLRPGTDLSNYIGILVTNLGRGLAKGTRNWPTEGYIIDVVLSSDMVVPPGATMVVTPAGQVLPVPVPSTYRVYREDMLIGRIWTTEDIPREDEVIYGLHREPGCEVIGLPMEYPSVVWPSSGGYRAFYIVVLVDPLNNISEAREDNNKYFFRLMIEEPL